MKHIAQAIAVCGMLAFAAWCMAHGFRGPATATVIAACVIAAGLL